MSVTSTAIRPGARRHPWLAPILPAPPRFGGPLRAPRALRDPRSYDLRANERTDAEAFAARSILARGLLARLTRASGGELMLTLAESAPRRAHQDLLGLAAALEPEALRSNVRLGVRMGREPVLFGSSYAESASAP